jgi:hypothetical protein
MCEANEGAQGVCGTLPWQQTTIQPLHGLPLQQLLLPLLLQLLLPELSGISWLVLSW